MLTLRQEQIKVFERAALRNFEDVMVAHSKKFSQRLCEVLGDEQVRVAVHSAIERCFGYGLTNQGPIRLFIELMLLFGSHFDTDPQYPWAEKILNDSEAADQMERAEQMYQRVMDYLEKVAGPHNINMRKALEALALFAQKPVIFSLDEVLPTLLQEMAHIFPQKVAYVGEEALTALINQGQVQARKYGFDTVRGEVLIATLMFAFGHGCADDPLYPWISQTIKGPKVIDPVVRARDLESKAVNWFDRILARPGEGAHS